MHQQLILVDQTEIGELLDDAGAAVDQHVLAIFLLPALDRVWIDLAQQDRFIPVRAGQ